MGAWNNVSPQQVVGYGASVEAERIGFGGEEIEVHEDMHLIWLAGVRTWYS